MKRGNTNPLHKLVCRSNVELVISPNMDILGRHWSPQRRGILLNQHLDGVQRIGIIPSLGSTDTFYLVAQFFPVAGDSSQSTLKRALRLASVFCQEHLVFTALSDNLDQCVLGTTMYKVPSHLEMGAFMDQEMYQVWVLFDREVDRGRAWLTLQGVLFSLGLQDFARVLPYPHFRATEHTEDVVWLPYFRGNSEMVKGQLLGGTLDGRGVMLDLTKSTHRGLADPPVLLEEISLKEFARLFEYAEPYLAQARQRIPSPQNSAGASRSAQSSSKDESALDMTLPGQFPDVNPTHDGQPPDAGNDASIDFGDSGRKHNTRIWQAVLKDVRRCTVRTGIFFDADPIETNIEKIQANLRSQVFTFPMQHLGLWRDAIELILGVEPHWSEDLICSEFERLTLAAAALSPIIMRARAARLPELRVALIVMKWLVENGGVFVAANGGCELRFRGNNYPVANTPPFSSLLWELTRDCGQPLQLTNGIAAALLDESLMLAKNSNTNAGAVQVPAVEQSVPGTTKFVRAMFELFDFATRPSLGKADFIKKAIKVHFGQAQVTISGTADKLCSVLRHALPKGYEFTPSTLRDALSAASSELLATGFTWADVSMGRGKRKEIQLTRAI